MPRGKKAVLVTEEKPEKKQPQQEVIEEPANKPVKQEVIEDDAPKVSRTRPGNKSLEGKTFAKVHNATTGNDVELPVATVQKLIDKNPNQFKIVD